MSEVAPLPQRAPETSVSTLVSAPASSRAPRDANPMAHRFQMIMFDWDAAVTGLTDDGRALARLAEPLLAAGCWLVVVTGASFDQIAEHVCEFIAPNCRQHLLVSANHGSEMYGFDQQGEAVLRFRRIAAPEEDVALTAIAESVRDELALQTQLDVSITTTLMNRRAINLIPVAEWLAPAGAEANTSRETVEARLETAGWHGGIDAVVQLAREVAARWGLDVRITCDVPRVEIGLTDAADAIAWTKREVIDPLGIDESDILLVGHQSGLGDGLLDSGDCVRTVLRAAPVICIGAEPRGVPTDTLPIDGGPSAIRALLAHQLVLHSPPEVGPDTAAQGAAEQYATTYLAPRPDQRDENGWSIRVRGVLPEREHVIESLLAVGNGFLGVRASLEDPHPASRPGTLVAGLYGINSEGLDIPTLVNAPDWLRVRLTVNGDPLTLATEGLEDGLTRTLNLRDGMLRSEWCGNAGSALHSTQVTVQTLRFVSQVRRGLALQVVRVAAAAPATISLQAWLEPPAEGLIPSDPTSAGTTWETEDGAYALGCRAQTSVISDGQELVPICQSEVGGKRTWAWEANPDHSWTFVRIVAFARDHHACSADHAAVAQLREACAAGLNTLMTEHVEAWHRLWDATDIVIAGDDEAQRQVRFALYHLLSAANPNDKHVSIPARGLTGNGYLGHVFWDTDIYLIPFYSAVWPEAARAMLMYRHATLPAARDRAAGLGYQGALFAWESADSGADVTPKEVIRLDGQRVELLCGTREQHISADIAYAVWQYWSFTHDNDFLLDAGAEIVLETARFWASRCQLEADGRYHVRQVIGPDEYHQNVDDNAYTNGMARWNLKCAHAIARMLAAKWPDHWQILAQRLALNDADLARWRHISKHMASVSTHDLRSRDSLLIEQFAGYFQLDYVDLSAYASRTVPMDVILGPERIERTQVIKQADVVMLLALLPDAFSRPVVEANFQYYEPRSGHGSSLSPAMHALVAARLGEMATSERYFHQSAEIDLNESAGAAAQGVHMAALGGFWSVVALGFAGLSPDRSILRLDPHLPVGWTSLEVPLQWRGRRLRCRVQTAPLRIVLQLAAGSRPLSVAIGNLHHRLSPGTTWECWWDDSAACWKEGSA